MKQFLNFLFLTIFSITTFGQNLKISELSSLTNAGVATLDVFPIVDVSANQTKKFSIGEFDLRYGFTTTAPLSKTAGASPVVSIPVATSSADGYLSSSNWSTFNNKVSLTGSETLTNKTLTAPIISTISNSGTVTIPTGTNTLVGRATTDTLTNKDYDGGTASNTSRVTLPKAAKTTLDGLTRKQGTIFYDTTGNLVYADNGSTLVALGATALVAPSRQVFSSSSGTYTTPANILYLKVRIVGAGGAGAANGSGPSAGAAGGNTTFGSATAGGGSAASSGGGGAGGAGGTNTTAYTNILDLPGQYGSPGGYSIDEPGSLGGGTPFGGGGVGGARGAAGTVPGGTPTGYGGGGGGAGGNGTYASGAGGGAGAFQEFRIDSPSATYSYSVGAGGSVGGAGGGGNNSGPGAGGLIIVEEYRQ